MTDRVTTERAKRLHELSYIIGCVDIDDRGAGENLGCVLAGYFHAFPERPDDETPDDERGGWTPWVLSRSDAALLRLAEVVAREFQDDIDDQRARAEKAEAERDRLAAIVEQMPSLVPTNWLDSILTGPDAVFVQSKSPNFNVEAVLSAVKARIREAAEAAEEAAAKGVGD